MDKERRAIRRDRNKQHLHQDRDEGVRRPREEDRPRDRKAWHRMLDGNEDDDSDEGADDVPTAERRPADGNHDDAE